MWISSCRLYAFVLAFSMYGLTSLFICFCKFSTFLTVWRSVPVREGSVAALKCHNTFCLLCSASTTLVFINKNGSVWENGHWNAKWECNVDATYSSHEKNFFVGLAFCTCSIVTSLSLDSITTYDFVSTGVVINCETRILACLSRITQCRACADIVVTWPTYQF